MAEIDICDVRRRKSGFERGTLAEHAYNVVSHVVFFPTFLGFVSLV